MEIILPDPVTGKRYNAAGNVLRKKFGKRAVKIGLNGGFTCPNRDGTKGYGGCTYCSASGSGEFAGDPETDIFSQFEAGKKLLEKKWGSDVVYIPYFQANTNTYAPLPELKRLFEEALSWENVAGLAVSTRPDCISAETADHLAEISKRTYLTVELGLQTVHDETAERINRCHTYEDFLRGYEILHSRGINVCVHIIDGLPGETREMMLETVRKISALDIQGVKIHLLHIIRGTKIYEQYISGEFNVMDIDEYVDIVCDQLEILPRSVMIERLTGDGAWKDLVAPLWSRDKKTVLNAIDKELCRRGTVQGYISEDNAKKEEKTRNDL